MRIVSGPNVAVAVVSRQTGAPLAGVTVTVNQTVYTDPELTAAATAFTTNGSGVISFYAPPGNYTFTAPSVAAAIEPVEVLGQEEGTGAQLRAGFLAKSATDSGGRTYTLNLDATNPPSTGTRGLVISRSAQGFPVGIRFEDTAGNDVAEIGLDSGTTDFIIYDDVTNGDIFRFAQGGYALFGRGVGHPGNTRRLDITSSAADATLASLLHFTNDTGSSTSDFIRGQNGAADVFNINKSGQAAFGKVYSGTISGGSLEVANAAVISAGVGVTPGLQIITTGNATNRAWTWQISTADGSISLKDSTGGNSPLQIQAGAAANTILMGTTYLRLGAAASTVGFYANSGAAQSTGWTTMTGTATKAAAGFDTSTVTLPQLAQVVKAVLDRILAMNMVSA